MFLSRFFRQLVLLNLVNSAFLWTAQGASPVGVVVTENSGSNSYGSRVVLTASVTPGTATGKVVFFDGAGVLGSAVLSQGSASLSTISLSSGQRQITAAYLGDATYHSAKSSPFLITITTGPGGSFETDSSLLPNPGTSLSNLVATDLNHDGYPDLVTVQQTFVPGGEQFNVLVFLNPENGTFAQSGSYPIAGQASEILIADVDLDGNQDIVLAISSGISVLRGNGDGTFSAAAMVLSVSDSAGILIADMTGDGVPDLVVGHYPTQSVSVLAGNGDGTFAAPVDTPVGVSVSGITGGDFNRDGIFDVAIASRASSAVTILLGVGNGTFMAPVIYSSGDAVAIAAEDINRDGIPDLITANFYDNSTSVLVGNGDGSFRPAIRNPINPDPNYGGGSSSDGVFSLFISDFDGDGIPDIAAGGGLYGGLFVFHGHGDGSFAGPIEFTSSSSLALADFNSDGLPDFATVSDNSSAVSILYGRVAPRLSMTASVNPAAENQPLTLTVTASYPAATGTITFTNGYHLNSPIGTAPLINGQAVLTMSWPAYGDGVVEFGATYSGDGTYATTFCPAIAVVVYEPGPALTLTASPNPATPGQNVTFKVTIPTNVQASAIAFYDGVNLLTHSAGSTFSTTFSAGTHRIRAVYPGYYGVGSSAATLIEQVVPLNGERLLAGPTYLTAPPYNTLIVPGATVAADFNHDGFADLAVLSSSGKVVLVYPGTGSGTFNAPQFCPFSFAPGAMVAGQFDLYGDVGVMVTDPGDNAVVAVNYFGVGSFLQGQTLPVGTRPAAIASADFNNDGEADIITANSGSNDVSVLLTLNGPSDFRRAPDIGAGAFPDAVVTGDFNGDGNADFVVANRDANNIMFFAGKGDGTFLAGAEIAAGSSPSVMITADLNRDGKPDIVVANASPGEMTILLGNGNGTFRNPIPLGGANGLTSIVAADLTGAGFPSLAVTTASGLLIFTGNGDGTFSARVIYSQYAGAASVSAAPFGNDGRMELAVSMPATNSVSFIRNGVSSTASLTVASSSITEGSTAVLNVSVNPPGATGQVDCFDGAAQVGGASVTGGVATITTTALYPGPHRISCRFVGVSGYGASTSTAVALTVNPVPAVGLAAAVDLPIAAVNAPVNLLAGDFNGDGIPDFVYERAGNGLIGQKSGPAGSWTEYNTMSFGGASPIAADFNDDGHLDIAAQLIGAEISLGNGDGTFRDTSRGYGASNQYMRVSAADFNNDGWIDLILPNPDGSVDVANGNGDGTFQAVRNTPLSSAPVGLAIGDFNEDGQADVVSVSRPSNSVTGNLDILLGRGDGTFTVTKAAIAGGPVGIASGDFDGDGHQDVAIVHSALRLNGTNLLSILHGNGNGTFTPLSSYVLPAVPAQINVADMNGDGKPDLIVLFTSATPAFAVINGNGDGSFQSPVLFSSTRYPAGLAVVDTNNDGRLDVVTAGSQANFQAPALEIFRGTSQKLELLQGSGQRATVNSTFAVNFKVTAPPGATVIFAAPASGPSGTFSGGTSSITVTANSSGVAAAPSFTANGLPGIYEIGVSAPGVAVSVNIPLRNFQGHPFPPQRPPRGASPVSPRTL